MANFNLPNFKKNDSQDTTTEKAEIKKPESAKKKFLKPKDINFYERYLTVVEGKQKQTDPKIIIIPLLAVIVIFFGIFGIIKLNTHFINKDNEEIQTYLTDNNSSYLESKELYENTIKTNEKIKNLKVMQDAFATYPQINSANFALLVNAASNSRITFTSIDYINTTGTMTISGITGKGDANFAKNPSVFVKALKNTNLFSSISYSGYTGDTDNGYSFNVLCVFK